MITVSNATTMDTKKAKGLLQVMLAAVSHPNGQARTNDFIGLRQVDAKVREAKIVIGALPTFGSHLLAQMDGDPGFAENSRRVRLETLANYCRTALSFLDAGVATPEKKIIARAPDVTKLTTVLPDLKPIIDSRWLEAQKCQHAGAYLSAVIMMGSVLEALLLARAHADPVVANRASTAPKDRAGKVRPIQDWSLSALIDVAAEAGWIKVDRKNFSHALRVSRNVVHPWEHVTVGADFDESTSDLSWLALKAAVSDLLASV